MDKGTGESIRYKFDDLVEYNELKAVSNTKGVVDIMRLKDGFNVEVSEVEVDIELECEKCLTPTKHHIEVDHFEKEFLQREPENIEDPAGLFLVNTKNLTIDLTEALRQEIILHFPVDQVCSMHCKGLCPKCGANKNEKECDCNTEEEGNKPLAGLKNLIK